MDTSNNTNKPFVVQFSELEGRLDPNFYKKTSYFNSRTYPSFKLSEIAFINPSTSFEKLNKEESITFVPMVAIDESDGIITKTFSKKIKDTQGFTRFLEGDLIWAKITPCMQNGKSAIVTKTLNGYACGSTEFFIIRPKKGNLLIGYIHFLLRHERVLEGAQNYFGGSAGQQRVSKDFLLNFNVPMPPMDVQKDIVALHNNAYTQKQQKEAEAEQLLQSIDTYILDKLGIIIPEKDNSLENRVFVTQFSEVTGGRLDPDYQMISYKKIWNCILSSRFEIHSLKSVSEVLNAGKTPSSSEYSGEVSDNPIIKVGSYTNDFIDLSKVGYTINKQNLIVKRGDIFILSAAHQSEYVGKHIKYLNVVPTFETSYVGELICVRTNNKINSVYLFSLLNLYMYKTLINREKTGQTSHVYGKDLKLIPIPLPPPSIQEEIANHITTIRNKAKQLKADAITVLNKAKAEIEEMIIG